MKLTVTFRHLASTEALKEHVNEKLQKIMKFLIRPIEAHVILSVEKFRHRCEVVLMARDFHATAIEINENMYAAIDNAIHKLEGQVRKHKEKIRTHHHRPLHAMALELARHEANLGYQD